MPGPHVLTPPPNHATSVRHYCPLYATTEKTHKQKFKKSPPGKIGAESTYLPPGIMFVT